MTKKEIRDIVRQKRKEYGRVEADSTIICARIAELEDFKNARTILCYTPMRGEVDVRSLFTYGKRLILPEDNPFPDPSTIDFAVIPGVAYDRNGNRLGRGGGFYDRLIPKLRCTTVGPAFSFQIFDEIPMEEWDVPVSRVITEE